MRACSRGTMNRMRQVLLVTAGAVFAVSVIVGLFALSQANQEQLELTARLTSRSQVLADSLAESIEPSYNARATTTLQRVIDRFVSNERLAGLGVFDNTGATTASSNDLILPTDERFITDTMDSDEPRGVFVRSGTETFYTYVLPLHESERVVGALAVVQNATYIDESIRAVWRDNIIRLVLQVALFGLAIFILVRWVFFRSITRLSESLGAIRRGEKGVELLDDASFLQPLAGEISKVTQSLRQARHAASEEARMRLEKLDSPWTAERLQEFIKAHVKDRHLVVVSNREPYVHSHTKDGIAWSVPAGGVITALETVMAACGGTWIAHGSGDADRETVDQTGRIRVPPDEPRYTLRRVWLSPQEVHGYYTGFSNEALWPLSHMAHTRPTFRKEDWSMYRKVNGSFAKIVLDEIRNVERPLVIVNDYHFALLPELIKKSRPDAQVAMFWHIPWPSPESFSICPWRKELLQGMLGADLVGFHTQQYCNNFIDTVSAEVESLIDFEHFSIERGGHRSFIKPFPISIAYPGSAEPRGEMDRSVLDKLGIASEFLALGVDRLDYTKGILERFKGVEFFLDTHPEYRERFTFLQIASPTRETVEKYREYGEQVAAEAERINKKFGTRAWQPIVFERRTYTHAELLELYRLAHVCLVTSLHDGMNLVAKEYVAARTEEDGALILSKFTGAARDLKHAIIINPYNAEESADALLAAITMTPVEQHQRMKAMRQSISDYNIYRWSAELIKALSQIG